MLIQSKNFEYFSSICITWFVDKMKFLKLQNMIGSLVVDKAGFLRGLTGGTWLGIFDPVGILNGIFEGVFVGVFVKVLPGVFGVRKGVVFSTTVRVWLRFFGRKALWRSHLVELCAIYLDFSICSCNKKKQFHDRLLIKSTINA